MVLAMGSRLVVANLFDVAFAGLPGFDYVLEKW
jgi:hypothetical protein